MKSSKKRRLYQIMRQYEHKIITRLEYIGKFTKICQFKLLIFKFF